MEFLLLVALLLAAIASVTDLMGGWALLTGRIYTNPQAFLMTISGIIAMWIAIILALIS